MGMFISCRTLSLSLPQIRVARHVPTDEWWVRFGAKALEESLLTHGGGKQPEGGEDHALVAALAASLTTSSSSQQQHAAGEYGGGGAVSHKRKAEELDPELAAAIALSLAGRGQGSGSAPIVVLDDSQDSEVIELFSSQEG